MCSQNCPYDISLILIFLRIHVSFYMILLIYFVRYLSYGSGPKRFPLVDVLQYALEFASSKPVCTSPIEDLNTSAVPTGTLSTQTMPR